MPGTQLSRSRRLDRRCETDRDRAAWNRKQYDARMIRGPEAPGQTTAALTQGRVGQWSEDGAMWRCSIRPVSDRIPPKGSLAAFLCSEFSVILSTRAARPLFFQGFAVPPPVPQHHRVSFSSPSHLLYTFAFLSPHQSPVLLSLGTLTRFLASSWNSIPSTSTPEERFRRQLLLAHSAPTHRAPIGNSTPPIHCLTHQQSVLVTRCLLASRA